MGVLLLIFVKFWRFLEKGRKERREFYNTGPYRALSAHDGYGRRAGGREPTSRYAHYADGARAAQVRTPNLVSRAATP
jgi:hypothetical protein